MTARVSPLWLRAAGALLSGGLMLLRAETGGLWTRALLAGVAFALLGALWRQPRRPLRLSVRFFRSRNAAPRCR